MTKVLLVGGSGSLGQLLARRLSDQGYEVVIFTRSFKENIPFEQVLWDGKSIQQSWKDLFKGSIVINLAGELVDRIPTDENISLLESSRVDPTKTLVAAAKQFGKPKLWLQMSTLAIYGDAGEQVLDESSAPASGPRQMVGVAKAWESAFDPDVAERSVIMRTAVVLQHGTPALSRLVTMTKWFLGTTVGDGKQWFSWVHADDFSSAVSFLINSKVQGIVHITSPNPVTNKTLMATLRRKLHRPTLPPTPAFAIKLGARLIFRTDAQLALTGRRAEPKKLLQSGFSFAYPTLGLALEDLLSK
jgi:uncharacterized protein (TIGR01777 family)